MAANEEKLTWEGLSSRDLRTRELAMQNIKENVQTSINISGPVIKQTGPGPSELTRPSELNQTLATLLMLSKRCPFLDIRYKSMEILSMFQNVRDTPKHWGVHPDFWLIRPLSRILHNSLAKWEDSDNVMRIVMPTHLPLGPSLRDLPELGIRVPRPLGQGPCRFIPEEEILQVGTEDANVHSVFANAFADMGRLDNITLVMVFHPQYLESFLKTQHYLLQMDGPLPSCYQHYIGIMAAARHQCSYLVNLHVNDFIHNGGDQKWLNGLENAPQKLRNLGVLNKLLAHRPWLITKEHIEQLLKTGEHSWSLAELIHAVVLLAHYHSLASFTFGCGISPEIHSDGGHTFRPPSVSNYCICDITNGNHGGNDSHRTAGSMGSDSSCEVEVLMEKMKQLQESREEEEASQEEMATRFEREKIESMLAFATEDEEPPPARDVSKHFEDTSYGYKDFSRRGMHVPTFRVQDFSWEDHGYSLVNRLYPDVGQLLDEKFHIAYNLTYNTMAMHNDVDTSTLRRAIWNYVHCMFGIRYDDYDYGEINQLLDRSFKVYIKNVVCSPEKTTKRMYDSFWRQFKHSEKVHVNLLLMEARMQAELLYALRAITWYMT